MSSLIQYFAAIVGFIREKAKIDITMDILYYIGVDMHIITCGN